MWRGLLVIVAAAATGQARAEFCEGPSDDGQTAYAVTVEKESRGKPVRVLLEETDVETTREFTSFDDITPPQPTDERYRYVFHDGEPAPGELAIMLLEGGFTQMLSAQIWLLGEGDAEPVALASLTCR